MSHAVVLLSIRYLSVAVGDVNQFWAALPRWAMVIVTRSAHHLHTAGRALAVRVDIQKKH